MRSLVLERPKMSRAVWESLKANIMKERQRKKQELEATAEVERQRKERERQLKLNSMTLSETKEQITTLDSRLTELKEEKHQLFLQLKRVLNEDETRRRQLINKEASNEMMNMHGYLQQGALSAQVFMQPLSLTRPPLYKVPPQQHQHTLIPPGSLKRSRSPSPPLQSHNYKFGPYKPPRQPMHSYPQKSSSMGLNYYHPPPSSSYPGSQYGQHQPTQPPPQPTMFTYAGAPLSVRDDPPKQHASLYRVDIPSHGPPPQTHGPIQPPHATIGQPRGSFHLVHEHAPAPQKFGEESPKYYPPPPSHHLSSIRGPSHLNLHSLPPQGSTGGYPIRSAVSSYQTRPPSPNVMYSGQNVPRLPYTHSIGSSLSSHQQQSSVQRFNIPRD